MSAVQTQPLAKLAAVIDELQSCVLVGSPRAPVPAFVISQAESAADLAAYHQLRRQVFVLEQGLFSHSDTDDVDDDPRTIVLLARTRDGAVLGGVRLGPVTPDDDIGWWQGGRLAVSPGVRAATGRSGTGIGASLVGAACARAESAGALRFDATVQVPNRVFFERLGWQPISELSVAGAAHVLMQWPIDRIARLAKATKGPLGDLVGHLVESGTGFRGDDAAPVPHSDIVAACDSIVPSMVERDPKWAGWCAGLVNVNDILAMGGEPTALIDAVAGPDRESVTPILQGLQDFARALGLPIIGGHTQLGVQHALTVTALGRTASPIAAGAAQPGERLRVTADLGGTWRPGYAGQQWDSSSHRTPDELRSLTKVVPALRPTAAKDVSMSGTVGTIGMLAEASGVKAVIDVASVPKPDSASAGDWLTCFPGFAMVTCEPTGAPARQIPDFLTSEICGDVEPGAGVELRWPDGLVTTAISAGVTGLGGAQ